MQEILAGLGICERFWLKSVFGGRPVSVQDGWEVRALFWAFLGKTASGDSKIQQRSSTDWIMPPCSAETVLLEKSSAQVGKWGKKRHQDWSELGSVLALRTFNYPGYGFIPTLTGSG